MLDKQLTARADETLDILSNQLQIIQRKKGHRASSDDLLLAWAVVEFAGHGKRMLDLGTGKGTVGLLALSRMPHLRVMGIEALPMSAALAHRNILLNDMSDRFSVVEGDIRNREMLVNEACFDVITGAPPFVRLGAGILPQDAQRAAGRFELLGGVEDYHQVASEKLTPDGTCIVLMDGLNAERNIRAAKAAGLHPRMQIDISPRPDRAPTYSICVSQKMPGSMKVLSWAMREREGDAWSARYTHVRQQLDLP
jgi:tRNA1Val (adenine37-N6)-methyltransferase